MLMRVPDEHHKETVFVAAIQVVEYLCQQWLVSILGHSPCIVTMTLANCVLQGQTLGLAGAITLQSLYNNNRVMTGQGDFHKHILHGCQEQICGQL